MSECTTRAELADDMAEYGIVTLVGTNRVSVQTNNVTDVLEIAQDHGTCVSCDEISEGVRNVVIDTSGTVGRARVSDCIHCAPALPCPVHVRGSGE